MRTLPHDRRGLTLIELLTVLSILAVATLIALPSYAGIRRNLALSGAVQEVANALRVAQNRSATSQQLGTATVPTEHGVHFEMDTFSVYGGAWASPVYTEPHTFVDDIQVCSGSGTDLTFARLTGKLNGAGPVTIAVGYAGCSTTRSVTVDPIGRITVQ